MINANKIDTHVGQRLRAIRKLNAMSQTTLGEAIGVTFQQVQKYERATNRISAGKLGQVAELFNVTPNWFFEGLILDDDLKDIRAKAKDAIDRADEDVVQAVLTLIKSKSSF